MTTRVKQRIYDRSFKERAVKMSFERDSIKGWLLDNKHLQPVL